LSESYPVGQYETDSAKAASGTADAGDVRARLAKQAGVSQNKIQAAITVHRADPELFQRVGRGEVTLREATARLSLVGERPAKRQEASLSNRLSPATSLDLLAELVSAIAVIHRCRAKQGEVAALICYRGGLSRADCASAAAFLNSLALSLKEEVEGSCSGAGEERRDGNRQEEEEYLIPARDAEAGGYELPASDEPSVEEESRQYLGSQTTATANSGDNDGGQESF
jgi:hypothetical protein